MKSKIILFTAILFISFANAQTKVGTIDSDYIIGKMPELIKVSKLVEKYGKRLDSSFQIKYKSYQTKVDAYKKDEKTLSKEIKKTMVNTLLGLEQELQKFKQNGNQLMQLKRDEVMRPLYNKLKNVIKEVAVANGFTQILTTTGNQFAYLDDKFDITKLVLNKLGIKIAEKK